MIPILMGPLAALLADAALLVVDALDEAGGLVGTAVGGTAVGATLDDALDAGACVGGAAVGTGVGAGAHAVITTRATSVTRTKMFRIFWFIFSSPRIFCACLFEPNKISYAYVTTSLDISVVSFALSAARILLGVAGKSRIRTPIAS